MNNKILFTIIITCLITGCLCGCTSEIKSDEEKILDEWFKGDYTFIFHSNGTADVFWMHFSPEDEITYEIKNTQLILNLPENSMTYDYSFTNNDNTLTLTPVNETYDTMILARKT